MSNQSFEVFNQKIEELAMLAKPKIAFGLKEPDKEILESMERSKKYADIILVGPQAIKDVSGFEKIIDKNPEQKIASMLANDEVAGIVRGTIDDWKTYETYEKLTGEKCTFNPALLESSMGQHFFMGPASNGEGWNKEEKLEITKGTAEFMKSWGFEPKIAVITGRRHDTYPRKKDLKDKVNSILNETYEDAEWIVAELKKQGFEAKNWAIDTDKAIQDGCNIIVPPNGMVGNQMFRMMNLYGSKILICPRLGLSRPYEDGSRSERDYDFHIKWLVAMINNKK